MAFITLNTRTPNAVKGILLSFVESDKGRKYKITFNEDLLKRAKIDAKDRILVRIDPDREVIWMSPSANGGYRIQKYENGKNPFIYINERMQVKSVVDFLQTYAEPRTEMAFSVDSQSNVYAGFPGIDTKVLQELGGQSKPKKASARK